jgi:hypothetical protein
VTAPTTDDHLFDGVYLSSRAFSAAGADGDKSFGILREPRPVSSHRPVPNLVVNHPDDPGFWAPVATCSSRGEPRLLSAEDH